MVAFLGTGLLALWWGLLKSLEYRYFYLGHPEERAWRRASLQGNDTLFFRGLQKSLPTSLIQD